MVLLRVLLVRGIVVIVGGVVVILGRHKRRVLVRLMRRERGVSVASDDRHMSPSALHVLLLLLLQEPAAAHLVAATAQGYNENGRERQANGKADDGCWILFARTRERSSATGVPAGVAVAPKVKAFKGAAWIGTRPKSGR